MSVMCFGRGMATLQKLDMKKTEENPRPVIKQKKSWITISRLSYTKRKTKFMTMLKTYCRPADVPWKRSLPSGSRLCTRTFPSPPAGCWGSPRRPETCVVEPFSVYCRWSFSRWLWALDYEKWEHTVSKWCWFIIYLREEKKKITKSNFPRSKKVVVPPLTEIIELFCFMVEEFCFNSVILQFFFFF